MKRANPDVMGCIEEVRPRPNVVALIYDGLCTFEFGIVSEVFGLNRPEVGGHLYDFSSVSLETQPVSAAGGLNVSASGTHGDLERADIIVVPGWRGKDEAVPEVICEALKAAHKRGTRLMSVCSGVYVLAAAGLLSGRRVTTHWRYEADFTEKFPDVIFEANALYVDEGDIITSAGSSAGIDACLHMVRDEYGARIANMVARRLVMHSHRQGGQAQFIEQPLPKGGSGHRLSKMMDEIRSSLDVQHTIGSMADMAGMTPRTFQRQFIALNGLPAAQWLTKERLSRSCQLLEATDMPMEDISRAAGFSTSETMRYHFRQSLNVSPAEYRKRFSTTEEPIAQSA